MYKLLNKLFGWDYVSWKKKSRSGFLTGKVLSLLETQ